MHTLHKRVFLLVISTLFSLSACSDSGVETESVDMDTEERLYTYRAIAGISMGEVPQHTSLYPIQTGTTLSAFLGHHS